MDYEQKYKELVGKIEKAYLYAQTDSTKAVLEDILPELKENEDERIRKELIENFKWFCGDYPNTTKWGKDDNLLVKDIIAWLEKQGEQKFNDKYTFNAIPRLLEMIEPTDRAKSYCQKLIDSLQTEGYVTDAKIVSDCLKQMNGEKIPMATMDEQKPTDKIEPKFKAWWNEEDERNFQGIIDELAVNKSEAPEDDYETYDRYLSWFKSLKDRLTS